MRVIVCGGRDYRDWDALFDALDAIHERTPISFLFHGNSRGADRMAAVWVNNRRHHSIRVFAEAANWARDGKAAGPMRNQRMLGQGIDLVIAFPGGKGTADMVRRARKAGVPVHEVAGVST